MRACTSPSLPRPPHRPAPVLLNSSLALIGALWLSGMALLLARWRLDTYLGRELA
jgi:hypothetical protein